jgi:bacteriocin-like protein
MRITRKGQHRPTSNKEATMKLIGKLKEEVEKAETAEKKKELIEEAGMELDDEELEQVSGGLGNLKNPIVYIGKAL